MEVTTTDGAKTLKVGQSLVVTERATFRTTGIQSRVRVLRDASDGSLRSQHGTYESDRPVIAREPEPRTPAGRLRAAMNARVGGKAA